MVSDVENEDQHSPGACDVCGTTSAALRCEACRLDLCVSCSRTRHRSSLHLTTGRFRFYRQEGDDQEDDSPSTASPPSSPAAEELRSSSETTTSDALWGFDDALAESIRALTFATDEEPSVESTAPKSTTTTTTTIERRPRSFSDYVALGDGERWRAQGELSELWDAMRTNFASRHVVVRCGAGVWDALDVRRVVDRLNNFGSVASTRRELTAGGLLFCTFFDLTSAVAAVDRWRADTDIISYCLPYELPDDVNSATLLVRFALGGSTAAELHHVCTCFGQVASVLQPDPQVAKFIVEYSDSRALPGALNGLPHAFHATGPLTVARTTPPTLDVSKLKLFQECLNRAAATHPRITRTRPKSFSSSSTSLLTSPTSSVASSLNASFLEGAGNNSPMASTTAATYPGELTSPVLMPQEEQQIWARPAPRARSNSSSSYLGGSLSSSSFGDSAYSNGFTLPSSSSISTLSSRGNGYSSFQAGNQISTDPQQHSYYDFRARQRIPAKFASMRSSFSNNDHFFRSNAGASGGHAGAHGSSSTGRPSTGRNDQGTGEFSLSIEKVASGEDKRTTLMIRNIPNKYTQQMLLSEINRNHRGNYDFFYLPIDFKNKCNMGYAFINFIEAAHIEAFHKEFDGQKWTNFNSEKVCAISYARLQGKQAMIARFQNSSLLDKHESYRPLVFGSSGSNRGKPEPFPAPKQIVHKKQSVHSPHFTADDYGSYVAHRMYAQQPPQQQQMQQQHSLAVYPQQLVGMPQHAMPPLPTPHFGMQALPLQYIPSYQQNDPQLASPFLYGVAGMPSTTLDYTT
ncbi:hypothetical protein L917_15504 [Phytophthora nicotianae]|uniref:B box-type domain-containing protein n=2 Tax=Phytophthora nicotianae TaxID=4792 RepID=W2PT98_PHYN3|nr:hypothetical protein PPTG_16287 [Phytophthora nicotianae INRA-310]ETK78114.1 hypothetical protein L915_15802 [Phytophthora nicotianae]KUF92569.1 hypothetical protein AM588_10004067 [Phytophthora nicotianae]ETL84783.1 hypothetical protein L917_15504 [Phytophthora nicotianae]ETN03235.1 hypothetical protein PPTG_16287 [Phytophthora nicotianae INRA-310]KUG01493.1 MEI2 3 protein [Phytophthora nicotianae]